MFRFSLIIEISSEWITSFFPFWHYKYFQIILIFGVQISSMVQMRSRWGRRLRPACWRLSSRVSGFSLARRTRRLIRSRSSSRLRLWQLWFCCWSWWSVGWSVELAAVFVFAAVRPLWRTLLMSSRISWGGLRDSEATVLADRWEILIIFDR